MEAKTEIHLNSYTLYTDHHFNAQQMRRPKQCSRVQPTLATSLVANAINFFFLGPKTSSIMFERHRLEKEEGIDAYKEKDKASPKMKQLSKTFAQLHGISSILNLASYGALLLHGSVSGSLLMLSVGIIGGS